MIPGSANSLLLASAAGAAQYQVERSLRFNSADSAYLSRTPSSAGNRKTWTWSGWVKKARTGQLETLFGAWNGGGGDLSYFRFTFNGNVMQASGGSLVYFYTNEVYRDPSAWYHIVLVLNTPSTVANERFRLYVNGTEISSFAARSNPAQNTDFVINSTSAHDIGRSSDSTGYLSGYLADIHFIDGQALTPSSFGYTDSNGVWQPKAYTGTYGTNGFHLDFADNSAASTAGIGKDVSGNGNDWTPNNLSVAAGAGNDSLVDTPTNYGTDTGAGGEVRGNYCTWNPVEPSTLLRPSNGGLELTGSGGGSTYGNARGTFSLKNEKFYWETLVAAVATYQYHGIAPSSTPVQQGGNERLGYADIPSSVALQCNDGNIMLNGGILSAGTGALAINTVVGHAFDGLTGEYWISVDGVWRTGNPAIGTSPLTTVSLSPDWFPAISEATSQTIISNFGQRPFAYTAPSGYKALCTTNLPDPQTITTSGSYTGNGSADGPFVYLNGVPTAMTIGGNAVTFGTEADKLSNGFKVRTASTTYNQNAATYNYSITSTGDPFKVARAQSNP